MRTRPSSAQLILTLCCSALLVSACGGDSRPSGTKPSKNNNTNNNTNNNNNTGGDCSANPNNCAPNELVGAAPGCTCLNVCATGFVWNPSTMTCDTAGNNNNNNNNNNSNNNNSNNNSNNNNSNNNSNNNNSNNNNNNNNMGECSMASDCPDAGDLCLEPQMLTTCAGQADCQCLTQCSPNVATTGCDGGEVCFWTNGAAIEGVCIPDPGGQAHGQACNAMFDPAGNLTGDNCAVNHYCWGAAADAPTGTCGRLCPPNDTVVCPALGNYACDTSVSQDMSIGLCFEPTPMSSDDAQACMSGPDCTISGRCVAELGGLCGADCSGLKRCASDSVCIPFTAPVNETCVLDCTAGGSPTCSARNAGTACHRFADGQGGTFGLCFPRCMDNNGCLAMGQTCNVATGECM